VELEAELHQKAAQVSLEQGVSLARQEANQQDCPLQALRVPRLEVAVCSQGVSLARQHRQALPAPNPRPRRGSQPAAGRVTRLPPEACHPCLVRPQVLRQQEEWDPCLLLPLGLLQQRPCLAAHLVQRLPEARQKLRVCWRCLQDPEVALQQELEACPCSEGLRGHLPAAPLRQWVRDSLGQPWVVRQERRLAECPCLAGFQGHLPVV